jgi:hypothetical protein
MKKSINILVCTLIVGFSQVFGQIDQFEYKRAITTESSLWNCINIPDDIFEKTKNSLQDIRIYGITNKKDTIEAPYILKTSDFIVKTEEVQYQIINESHNDKGYYYTIAIPKKDYLNYLHLNFDETNFDWLIDLEASQDQKEWFTIQKGSRILSIENAQTNFSFTDLVFPTLSYSFLRIHVKSKTKVSLNSVKAQNKESTSLKLKEYKDLILINSKDKKAKTTELIIDLKHKVPVSNFEIGIKENHSFYRPFIIQYLVDSVKTQKGWYYNYQTVHQSILSSESSNGFYFEPIISKKFKITIYNNDNSPLKIRSVKANGFQYQLITRINEEAKYFLCYGNENEDTPEYDLNQFQSEIPDSLSVLVLGQEIKNKVTTTETTEPLIQNMTWLWLIMSVVVVILLLFSYKMLRK